MSLKSFDALILIAINQGNGDTVPSLAKSLAAYESDVERALSQLEEGGFVSRQRDETDSERIGLCEKGRTYLIETDMYRTLRLV